MVSRYRDPATNQRIRAPRDGASARTFGETPEDCCCLQGCDDCADGVPSSSVTVTYTKGPTTQVEVNPWIEKDFDCGLLWGRSYTQTPPFGITFSSLSTNHSHPNTLVTYGGRNFGSPGTGCGFQQTFYDPDCEIFYNPVGLELPNNFGSLCSAVAVTS